jgi:hypothetical protein
MALMSCSDNDNDDGDNGTKTTTFTSVAKSVCSGDSYGMGVNIIDLELASGNTKINSEGKFEGEGSCLVLALYSKMTDTYLPSDGTYQKIDWDKNLTENTFEPGICEYQSDYSSWMTMGTYLATIDKAGNTTYTPFTGGTVTIKATTDGYDINVDLLDSTGVEYKGQYTGKIDFTVPQATDKYQYEDATASTPTMKCTSADIRLRDASSDYASPFYQVTLWGDNNTFTQLIVYAASDAKGMIADGDYAIAAEPKTNQMLAGYYANETCYGCYLSQWDETFSHINKVWYLVDGKLNVKTSGDNTTLTLTSTSAHGSTVNISYTGTYAFKDLKN